MFGGNSIWLYAIFFVINFIIQLFSGGLTDLFGTTGT